MNAAADQTPPEWVRVPADIDGIPVWRRREEPCYVATRDMDQLRFLAAALTLFDQMSATELHAFVTPRNTYRGTGEGVL